MLGANAMALRTLVASSDFPSYRAQAQGLVWGIRSVQRPSGALRPLLRIPLGDEPIDEEYMNYFFSGEAILALQEYALYTQDQEVWAAAMLSLEFYFDRYITQLDRFYFPAYVPWHTLALNLAHRETRDPRFARGVFRLNDRLLEILDRQIFAGRFYNADYPQYGAPHSASDGVYAESLAHAYEVAQRVGDAARRARYGRALALAVTRLGRLQFTEPRADFPGAPYRYLGAIPIRENIPHTRVDCTQHALDAFDKLLEVVQVAGP
jgi:hypothetical protein